MNTHLLLSSVKKSANKIQSNDSVWSCEAWFSSRVEKKNIRWKHQQYVPYVVTLSPSGGVGTSLNTAEILQLAANTALPTDLLPT